MKRGVLAVALSALVLGATGVASAGSGAVRDPRNDAKASWDILRISVDNGSRSLRIKMIYRGRLRTRHTPQGLLANIAIDTGTNSSRFEGEFSIDMLRGSTGPVPDRLVLNNRAYERIPCKNLRVRVQTDPGVLDFVLPQTCLGAQAGRVRVGGHTYSPRGAADEADYLEKWSQWIRRG